MWKNPSQIWMAKLFAQFMQHQLAFVRLSGARVASAYYWVMHTHTQWDSRTDSSKPSMAISLRWRCPPSLGAPSLWMTLKSVEALLTRRTYSAQNYNLIQVIPVLIVQLNHGKMVITYRRIKRIRWFMVWCIILFPRENVWLSQIITLQQLMLAAVFGFL